MSSPKFDVENRVSKLVASYLKTELSVDVQRVSPVVSYFDPMSVTAANRFVIEVPSVTTMAESPGNFSGVCKVTVKSQWAQKTAEEDIEAHFQRVSSVRQELLSIELMDDMNAKANECQAGIQFDYIQPKRDFETKVDEIGFIYSDTNFRFNGFFPA